MYKIKKIAILLTCHNRKDKTIQCLDALYACVMPNDYCFDVFLVDDGSTDGTSDAIKANFPNVNIIQGSGNLYWNRGMHLAWQNAAKVRDFDFYLWLNDDTILFKESLNALIETAKLFEYRSIVVGATCATIDQNIVTYGGWCLKNGKLSKEVQVRKCDYFNGNIVLIPKFVFNIVGINDPFFHHALGDFDYGLRAKRLGINSYVASGILGICDEHENLSTWCNPKFKFSTRWKSFRSPLGHNPEEFFVFEKRHNGFIMAIYHYITNHLRLFFPMLWIKIK